MKAKLTEQARVKELRKRGLSYREIMQRMDDVSKSSISLWCRGIKLRPEQRRSLWDKRLEAAARGRETIAKMRAKGARWARSLNLDVSEIRKLYWEEYCTVEEVAERLGVSRWVVYNRMKKNNIPRRTGTEANYVTYRYKPQFKIKEDLTPEEENLRIAGIMLYWAEGYKSGYGIDFANSEPQMIKVFLKFLRQICGVSEDRLRVYLYAYSYQNIDKLKNYWHEVTGIPLTQFTKPYIRKSNPNLSERKMPCGLIHIRYNDKRLLEGVIGWIKEYMGEVD